jgi:UDP-N-acetylglucosamine 3-dehydrogenase
MTIQRASERSWAFMKKLKNPVGVGIIGCGEVAQTRHLPILQSLANAETIAIADIDAAILKDVGDRFNISHCYTRETELLQRSDIEVAAICVPAQFHYDVSVAALAAGKHLFIEKPLTLTLADSDRLIEKAQQCDRKIMVGFNLRRHRLTQEVKQLIDNNKLGKIKSIHTVFSSNNSQVHSQSPWRQKRAVGGGVIFEQSTHAFDLWRFLLDSEIAEVFAWSQSEKDWEDESATITAKMANGVLTTGTFCYSSSNQIGFEIFAEAGRLVVSLLSFDGLRFFPTGSSPGDIPLRLHHLKETLQAFPNGLKLSRQGGDYLLSYRHEWEHLLKAIQADCRVESSLKDGRAALQGVLAAIESVETRKPVVIRSP